MVFPVEQTNQSLQLFNVTASLLGPRQAQNGGLRAHELDTLPT